MKIADVKELESSVKGFIVTGKVFYVGEVKDREKKATGEAFTVQSIGVSDGKDKETDSIFVEFSNLSAKEEFTKEAIGETISCISCRINDWQGKRNLRASQFSFTVIPDIAQISPEELYEDETKKEDIAHPNPFFKNPELPKTTVIEDKEPEKAGVWDIKDLKIIRQNSNQHATALVCKYFKAKSLEEAVAKTILVSKVLVNSVYEGLDYPIEKPDHTEKFEQKMKEATQESVEKPAITAIEIRIHELKKKLASVSGSEAIYYALLVEVKKEAEHCTDLSEAEQKLFLEGLVAEINERMKS